MPSPSLSRRDKSTKTFLAKCQFRPQLECLENRMVLSNLVTDVTTGHTFTTITAAINDATTNNGDTIKVSAGTYLEDVIVTKSLTFQGPNAAINPNGTNARGPEAIIEPATTDIESGIAVLIETTGVTFDGFTLEGSTGQTGTTVTTNGAVINSAYGFANINNSANDNYAVGNLTITNNIVKDFNQGGIAFDNLTTPAVASTGNTISNNKIDNVFGNSNNDPIAGTGIIGADNFYASITGNVITRVQDGIFLQFYNVVDTSGHPDVVSGNQIGSDGVIANGGFGITGVYYSDITATASPWTFSNNNLTALTGSGADAAQTGFQVFRVFGGNSGTFTNNNVTGGVFGVEFFSDPTAVPMVWQGGTISGSGVGFLVTNTDITNGNSNFDTQVSVNQTTITGATTAGIEVQDKGGTNLATVNISQAAITNCPSGILISGVTAHAIASITKSDIEKSTTAGINVSGGELNGLTNSLIKNNAVGILIGASSTFSNSISDNDLSLNTVAVSSQIPVDVSGNWFGTNNATTILNNTSGEVDFSPYLNVGTNSAPMGSGFQGVFTTLDVSSLGAIVGSVGRIQKAINLLVTAGGVINVQVGTYVENDDINKPVVLNGTNQATTILEPAVNGANPGGSGVLPTGASTVILIDASGVNINNLTIEGANPNLTGGSVVNNVSINARNGIVENGTSTAFSGTTISNVTVKDVYYRGINLGGTNFSITSSTVSNVAGDPLSAGIANIGGTGVIGSTSPAFAAGLGNTISNATSGIIDNNAISSIIINNKISSVNIGIHVDNVGSGTNGGFDVIQGNTITTPTGTSPTGIYSLGAAGNVSVQYNTITGFQLGLAQYGSTQINGANAGTTTFLGNAVDASNVPTSTGILLTTQELGNGSPGSITSFVRGNTLSNATTGLQVTVASGSNATETVTAIGNAFRSTPTAVSLGTGVDGSTFKFNDNSFEASSSFIDHGVGTLDATSNYWGSPYGPTVSTNTPPTGKTTGTAIVDSTTGGGSGTVTYNPYLFSSTGTASFKIVVLPQTGILNSTTFTVTITALLAPSFGTNLTDTNYTGTVSLYTNGLLNLPATVTFTAADKGVKTLTAMGIAIGSYPVVAADASTGGRVQSVSSNVNVTGSTATTTTTLQLGATFAYDQTPVTLTATVTPSSGAVSTPTGSVVFFVDGNFLQTVSLNSSGVATFSYQPSSFSTPAGSHTLQAYYSGDSAFLASTSLSSSLFVEKTPPKPLGFIAVGSGQESHRRSMSTIPPALRSRRSARLADSWAGCAWLLVTYTERVQPTSSPRQGPEAHRS